MKYYLQGEIMIKNSTLVVVLMIIFLAACNQSGADVTMTSPSGLPGYPVGVQPTDSGYPAPIASDRFCNRYPRFQKKPDHHIDCRKI
jgi:hypothetical protein